MSEIDYWELYGVEKPAQGGEGQENEDSTSSALRAPSPQGEGNGRASRSEEAADAADSKGRADVGIRPYGEGVDDDAEGDDDGETEGQPDAQAAEAGQGGKKPQSREENARFAAARRKQERDAAVQQARDEERQRSMQEMDALIAGIGLDNPYTGERITTKAEYDAYRSKHQEKQHESRLREMHMSQQEYDAMIAGLPEVQEAKRVTQQAQRAEWDRRIKAEMEQVAALNPKIQTVEDLVNDSRYDQVKGYLDRGMTIPEAYQLAHMDELTDGKSRQKAINLAGKAHMSATRARGQGPLDVPDDVMQSFLEFNPTATREEIAAFYNRRHGGK